MELFKGKSPSERNKIIAAIVLGVLAVGSLFFAFGPGLFSSGTTVAVTVSPTPNAKTAPSVAPGQFQVPSKPDQDWEYSTVPIAYRPGDYGASPPGRNIFAFYEPPQCYPNCPTPYKPPTPPPTPVPTPTPDYLIAFIMPQSIYAGSRGFRLEVNGDMFTPDAKIYFNQALLPTNYVNPQKLTADVPANMIAGAGPRQILVQSLDGTKYSLPGMINVQPQPKPQLLYIGMVSRKYGNNDTAYFVEPGKVNTQGTVPQSKRLNDIIEGRFRLVSIATDRVMVEDVNLGFRHPVELYRPTSGTTINTGGGGFPVTGFPSGFPVNAMRPGSGPGFPGVTMPRPPAPAANANRPRPEKRDEDDDDDDPK